MTQIIYNPTDDEDRVRGTTNQRITFKADVPVELASDDPRIAKFLGHPEFQVIGGEATASAPTVEAPNPSDVEIPDGWQELSFAAAKALARRLDPSLTNKATGPEVQAAIEAEVARRVASGEADEV